MVNNSVPKTDPKVVTACYDGIAGCGRRGLTPTNLSYPGATYRYYAFVQISDRLGPNINNFCKIKAE